MDQTLAKRTLQELVKREDLKNKTCADCGCYDCHPQVQLVGHTADEDLTRDAGR